MSEPAARGEVVRVKEEAVDMPSPVHGCLGKESPSDHIPEGIERSSSWCSSADSGYGSGSQDDGTHSASSRSTVQLGSAAWSPLRTRSAAVVQQTLTPTRNGAPCPAEAGGSTRSKRRLMLQESQDSDTTRASSKRRFLDDDSTGALSTAGTAPITPVPELASRLLLVDRPSAPSSATSCKIDAAVERGWKVPHMPSVECKVRSMLVEEQDVSRVMCRVKGLNKLPLNKIKAALKDNTAVNMVSAETLPLMSRACEVFIKVLVMRSVEESLAQNDPAHKRPDDARRTHVSHRHVEFAMLHPTMQVIAERGDSLSCDDDDDDDDDEDEQHSGMASQDTKAKTFPQIADPSMQGACGMSLDGPDPTASAEIVTPLGGGGGDDDDGSAADHVQDDFQSLVHVGHDDGGVDYILPAYYAPIVSQGAYMMPPTLTKQPSFNLAVWSGFAPHKSGATTPTPLCDAPGGGAAACHHHDDWLDCLKEGDDAGLGAFEESGHVLDQAPVALDRDW